MSHKRSFREIYEEVKERKIKHEGRFYNPRKKLLETSSESELVIDDGVRASTARSSSAKRPKIVKLADEPFHIVCSWSNCGETFEDEMKSFKQHVNEHTMSVEQSKHGTFVCEFAKCNYETEWMDQLLRHTDFHCYHERLKNIGKNIAERNAVPKCKLDDCYSFGDIFDYVCEWYQCNKIFSSIIEYFDHVHSHCYMFNKTCPPGEFVNCEWLGCSAKFTQQGKFLEHVRSHTKEKTAACASCGSFYGSNTKLLDHHKKQIPLELSRFQCSECSKLCPTESILRDHMRSHVNSYKCNFCDMTCPKPSMLASHIRFRHMDERPYKCTLCKFAAVSKCNLEQHLNTHSAEKLICCGECDFQCRSMYCLERHQQKEHGGGYVNNYECHCCQARFARGGYLTNHLMKEHGFKWPSGHSRFKYKQDADGILRLQTVRYESLEVTQLMMNEQPKIIDNVNYKIVLNKNGQSRIPCFELKEISDEEEDEDYKEDVLNE